MKLEFKSLTEKTWNDFVTLFGERGACGGCWCMYWRLPKAAYEKGKGSGNKKAMAKLVKQGQTLGLLAYHKNEPVAWCAFAPRKNFIRLEKSRVLKPLDDKPVWSIPCFFIRKDFRQKGVSTMLLEAVKHFAKKTGADILEAYPAEPYSENVAAAFAWTGFPSAFTKAGFEIAARPSKTRPIMRYHLIKP